ncbi:MAG: aldo/keto reductase [Maribacter sp.]
MGTTNKSDEIKRREFLQTGAVLATSTIILPFGGYKLFGAPKATLTENEVPTVTLNNGVAMPMLGFGTSTLDGATGERCVNEAISVGYRLIDTAMIYGNEKAVGAGIKKSGIARKELFITSKLWASDMGYESAKKAFQTSLDKLGTDYLDLYLIHRPRGDVKGSWKAMEELYEAGKIKAIGLSNFEANHLEGLFAYAKIKPVINQIETHVFFQQHKAQKVLKQHDIQMEAWSPFARGRNNMFTDPIIAAIGATYNKSNAQVCLRWLYQRGIVAIPRTSQKAHMIENLDIFDFELNASDMQAIAKLDLNTTQFPEWG